VPASAAQALDAPGVEYATDAGPALTATLDTPRGCVTLRSD
jgi:hypothetical protein